MADDQAIDENESLGEWASRYRGVATFGALALLLGSGKFLGFHWEKFAFLRRIVVPPAVVSGVLGCVIYRSCKGIMPQVVKEALDGSLTEVVVVMINFTFAALTLGFASSGTYVARTRAVLASIWHEALPMLVYSQVLIWGQSCVALGTIGLLRLGNSGVSKHMAVLVTTGLETGRDVRSFSSVSILGPQADEVERLADSVGLLISIIACIALMTVHMGGGQGHAGGSRGYALLGHDEMSVGSADNRIQGGEDDEDAGRHREHFHRGRGRCGCGLIGRQAERLVQATRSTRGEESGGATRRSLSPFSASRRGQGGLDTAAAATAAAAAPEAGIAGRDRGPTLAIHRAGLGAHLLLPAVSVGAAWLLDLAIRFVENRVRYTAEHHILSGFRLFKLSMCAALLFMCLIRRTSPFRYHSEWFFRISGLCLDLMTTAAISSIGFASIPEKDNAAFLLVMLACLAWNVVVFAVLAPRMFPNFWFMRATSLIGDALGHSWVGLLVLRAMDPRLQTPVPLAYAYKMMMFFVPASGGKNAIVFALVSWLGEWYAFVACLFVCLTWLWVFDWHFKARMPQHQQKRENERAEKKRERSPARPHPKSQETELVGILASENGSTESESSPDDYIVRDVRLHESSKILTPVRLRRLAEALPIGQAIKTWRLAYSISRDGASLWTLLQNCVGKGPCLIVVEDSWGYVFGGYLGRSMQDSQDYYGNGESFVFSFHPTFKAYHWMGANDYFCISNESWLAMGGGGGGFAFQIDDELDAGESNCSDTFGSPRLSSNEFFRCLNVEVWVFSDRMGV